MNTDLMFSSKTDNWSTPRGFSKPYIDTYGLKLDVCADENNAQCEAYYTVQTDGLSQQWNQNFWMNPPYGRTIGLWVKKAYEQSQEHGVIGVCLLPARTDTKWFHEYCKKGEINFIKGRLKFGNSKNAAPFPSMVVIFKNSI